MNCCYLIVTGNLGLTCVHCIGTSGTGTFCSAQAGNLLAFAALESGNGLRHRLLDQFFHSMHLLSIDSQTSFQHFGNFMSICLQYHLLPLCTNLIRCQSI